MEEPYPQPERRSHARYAVDAEASLILVNQGAAVSGRLFELSLDGCRVRADRGCPPGTPAGIEVMFRLNGIAFRLAGTMQWIDARQGAGIHFSPMAPRRREALEELLAELEADEQARHATEAQSPDQPGHPEIAASQPPASMKADPLSIPGGATTDARPADTTPAPSAVLERQPQPPFAASGNPARPAEPAPAIRPARRERRAEVRHAVDTGATVFFIDVRAQISGRILDLSMSGCCIRTFERFPVGIYRRVETEFKVDGLLFRLAGVVQALRDRFTVGIRFLDMSPRKRDQLAQLMEEIGEMQRLQPGSRPDPL